MSIPLRRAATFILPTAIALFGSAQASTDPCPSGHDHAVTFYVSASGSDSNAGTTAASPFQTIQTGVNCLTVAGDKLLISAGTYTEFVRVSAKGLPAKTIVIEGQPGVIIQGSITSMDSQNSMDSQKFGFHTGSVFEPNGEWIHPIELPPGTHHPQEYISRQQFPLPPNVGADRFVQQGAFIQGSNRRHTRLITYSQIQDLRADNETFDAICESSSQDSRFPTDSRPGFTLPAPSDPEHDVCKKRGCEDCRHRRPYVYMGPGLWFNNATNKVHIRLSPTHNQVNSLADYAGPHDPNQVPLSIVGEDMRTLIVESSSYITFKNLSFRFGSSTIGIKNSHNITFDDVTIWAGRYGARASTSKMLRFSNCVFDGGLPTWMFRSDLKDTYKFIKDRALHVLHDNKLGKATMETLYDGNHDNVDTEIDHCEFTNAHDLYLVGDGINFHHNWISNLHDEGLFLDGGPIASGWIHHNVLLQILSAISFAGKNQVGPWLSTGTS